MKYDKLYTKLPCKAARLLSAVLVIASGAVLAACGQKAAPDTVDYIGIDAAKEAALKEGDISAGQAALLSAGLNHKNGIFYYEVIFQENDVVYEYDIDALTGVVIEKKQAPFQPESLAGAAGETEETAVTEEAAVAETIETEVASETAGAVLQESADFQRTAGNGSGTKGAIDSQAAFSIALSHAGLTEADISFHQIKADMEDGRYIFEVEFMTLDGIEYDYELSADNGDILSYDYDAEFQFRNAPVSGTGIISEEQAKKAVLDRVPGASAEKVMIHLEEDDGRMEYEGKLIYDNMEYEFKIDAYSGVLIEWEAESLSKW